MFEIALRSLRSRRLTVVLTIATIALATLMLLGVDRVRNETRTSFANTVSGTDLIVGARTGSIQLLLYSVFRVGNATNNIDWHSYQKLAADPRVAWTIPVSLGDSHHGYPVLGTNHDYFRYLRYGDNQPLKMQSGHEFSHLHDVVLGANIARRLHYQLGQKLVLTHGSGDGALTEHADQPFTVTGILAPTGTPVDDTLHISLDGLTAIHQGWESGSASLLATTGALSADEDRAVPPPDSITAFYVGLKSRTGLFGVQRAINQFRGEPLMAILPGVALSELWQLLKVAEQALQVLSWFVLLVGLLGMMTALLVGLNERRREMAILRSVGARPWQLFALVVGETACLLVGGIAIGCALLQGALAVAGPLLRDHMTLLITPGWPTASEWLLMGCTLLAGLVVSFVPAWRAYRLSLSDGLHVAA
ncbi:ABC transporter permease [Jeongeupia chitinilytica]|uniref:Peptide ABC transporter permease n=1 Tax=Jeongeupia chitinilytica TaxID=1041641 RepID=A0ABQ3H4B5_9NEIS|nr:ABC transporter permease [Jeongeupia chitinilytica]GHD69764.1 hypothetical protein GCM10007350_36900 [Jeongeupia chitinilytica]